MDSLARQGKIHYVAMSSAPAWQISCMQAIADLCGWAPQAALQAEHDLVECTGERDPPPIGREMGLGMVPCSPLVSGVLTGKYTRADLTAAGPAPGKSARKCFNLALGAVTERNPGIAEILAGCRQGNRLHSCPSRTRPGAAKPRRSSGPARRSNWKTIWPR